MSRFVAEAKLFILLVAGLWCSNSNNSSRSCFPNYQVNESMSRAELHPAPHGPSSILLIILQLLLSMNGLALLRGEVFYVRDVCTWLRWTQQLSQLPRWLSGKESACNAGHLGSIPRSGTSPGEGNSTLSSILAWKTPWTEMPSRLQPRESIKMRCSKTSTIYYLKRRIQWDFSLFSHSSLIFQFFFCIFQMSIYCFVQKNDVEHNKNILKRLSWCVIQRLHFMHFQ